MLGNQYYLIIVFNVHINCSWKISPFYRGEPGSVRLCNLESHSASGKLRFRHSSSPSHSYVCTFLYLDTHRNKCGLPVESTFVCYSLTLCFGESGDIEIICPSSEK